jgi:hypothetical protein
MWFLVLNTTFYKLIIALVYIGRISLELLGLLGLIVRSYWFLVI